MFPPRSARTRSTTRSSSTSSCRWPLQGGLPSLLSNERKVVCLFFYQMISKQRATSVGFDDLVDAFRFECRVQELNGCRKIYPKDPKIYLFIFTLLCSEIFHSLFVSTSSNQTFSLSKFFAVLSVLPPLFHGQKTPPFKLFLLYLLCSLSLLP